MILLSLRILPNFKMPKISTSSESDMIRSNGTVASTSIKKEVVIYSFAMQNPLQSSSPLSSQTTDQNEMSMSIKKNVSMNELAILNEIWFKLSGLKLTLIGTEKQLKSENIIIITSHFILKGSVGLKTTLCHCNQKTSTSQSRIALSKLHILKPSFSISELKLSSGPWSIMFLGFKGWQPVLKAASELLLEIASTFFPSEDIEQVCSVCELRGLRLDYETVSLITLEVLDL